MKVFSANYLDMLTTQAQVSPRKRQHRNIHENYEDPCQRLFNAIELGSYIRPHKHATDPRDELLVAVRGVMVLMTFDDRGKVKEVVHFGSDRCNEDLAVGVEVQAGTWHTVFALTSGCVLLEVKAGPFDPSQPKDLAPWAPAEDAATAEQYLQDMISRVNSFQCQVAVTHMPTNIDHFWD